MAQLSGSEWRALLKAAIETRLTPILARAIKRSGAAVRPPGDVAAPITDQYLWHELNALRQQAALARVTSALSNLGFTPIALKGVALAHRSYPDPVLRPMRDLDVLLPAPQSKEAQRALLAGGAHTIHPDLRGTRRTSPEHLPPLQDTVLEVTIEIHHRIGTWPGADVLRNALVQSADRWPIAGGEVVVPSRETNLLHLVASAVIKDRLAISAIVLADLHYLAAGPLDWDEVWDLAGKTGLRNALALLAGVATRFGACWVPPVLGAPAERAQAHVDNAVSDLLRPASVASRQKIVDRVARASETVGPGRGALSLALSPEPVQLARIIGVAPSSGWRWVGYPVWLAARAFTYTLASVEAWRLAGDAAQDMRAWLEQE